ncbi:MAG TPA: hypothetical protein VE967_17275 [Gemmatimonadaceae bacterium]|nr:hypothetical protein [Gemmatimonadaceae bacterium]
MTAPSDTIVPIETLFYADAGPHVVASGNRRPQAGSDLHSLLASGIAGLTDLETEPFSTPVELDDTVPIGDLVYRGRTALDRARELRTEILARGGAPVPEEIEELFALLDLAQE